MEISEVISTNKAAIVIQINPQAKDSVIYADEQEARGTYQNSALKGFFKGQPKALGTVQIMIGVMAFSFGILFNANVKRMLICTVTGINYWGSVIYISAGSLSVAAQNKLNPCVVKASLGMNVFSAMTAAIAIFLMGLDLSSRPYYHCTYNYYSGDCDRTSEGFVVGTLILFLVFSSLQFIISICIGVFACKATSNNDSTVVSVALNQRY